MAAILPDDDATTYFGTSVWTHAKPVSYTHLDVYKRQSLMDFNSILKKYKDGGKKTWKDLYT